MKTGPGASRTKTRPREVSPSAPQPAQTEEGSTSLGVVIVAHGSLAPVLQENAEGIVGELPRCRAIHVDQNVNVEEARTAIGQAIRAVDGGGSSSTSFNLFIENSNPIVAAIPSRRLHSSER